MKTKRILYFLYYLKELDKLKFRKFLHYAKNESHRSVVSLGFDIVYSSFRFNISILDYFYFRFYNLNEGERCEWAGTGYLYEYQLRMNPKGAREVLENKIRFLNYFNAFVMRDFADINQVEADSILFSKLLSNQSGRLVIKGSGGQVGKEVEIVKSIEYTPEKLLKMMKSKGYDLVEEYVVQHPALMELSPSGLNTVRIFTQLSAGNVDILGARLRVSVNSPVDNMAAGNLAAPVDLETGIVNGPGVYSDITKADSNIHPVTNKAIVNFKIPFWKEALDMAKRAATLCPDNRSIGWDIAITAVGPELIEGNHNWCKLLWQLPVKQGLKKELEKYL
jgi:Sugar-transfer associated ATP-grasp